VSIVYLVKRSVLEHSADIDFRFIWTAGKLWALGINPYSPRFTALGHAYFPAGNGIAYWLYPPQWWVMARPLAALPVEQALVIWRGSNALLLVSAATPLALTVRHVRPATPLWAVMALIAIMALMEGTAKTLLLGQTSILVFAGFCLMGVALLTARPWPMVVALVLLLLKPQFALPIILCLAMMKTWRNAVLIAVVVTCLASLPQVVQFGLLTTVTATLGNIALSGQLPSNQPDQLIGVSHLVWLMTGKTMSNPSAIALDVIVTLGLATVICRRPAMDARDQASLGLVLIAPGLFFLPLHAYDSVALGPIAMLAVVLSGAPRYLAWAAVALALRAGVVSGLFGDRVSGDLLVLSLAALVALMAAVAAAVRRPQTPKGAADLGDAPP
jgi:hypothetical protein